MSKLARQTTLFERFLKKSTKILFGKHLLVTNIFITSSLSAVGDRIKQKHEIQAKEIGEYDPQRTFKTGAAGAPLGLVAHSYILLDKMFPERSIRITFYKMLVSQVVLNPFEISAFISALKMFEHPSTENFWVQWWRNYILELTVWPVPQTFNFLYMPLRYRVLYENVASGFFESAVSYGSYVKYSLSEQFSKKTST